MLCVSDTLPSQIGKSAGIDLAERTCEARGLGERVERKADDPGDGKQRELGQQRQALLQRLHDRDAERAARRRAARD